MRLPLLAVTPLLLAALLALAMAPQLHGAGAADLVGVWNVDGEATWDSLRKSAQLTKQLANVPPEMVEQIKATVLIQVAATTYQFTTDKLTTISNGLRREESYTISATNGNVLTADCLDDQGKSSQSKVTVGKDRLELINTASPDEVIILKRLR